MSESPDPALLLKVLEGETVFGLDTDSKIRQAANEVSALLAYQLYKRCDTADPEWVAKFADDMLEYSSGDPCALIGFDDGRWQGLPCGEKDACELEEIDEEDYVSYFLRLDFRDKEAAYYMFSLFPALDEPYIRGAARKRTEASQYLRVDLARAEDLQPFIQGLRGNPHLLEVHEVEEDEFWSAPSHGV